MCDPTGGFLIAGAAMSVLGTGMTALQANAQAKYQARISERNAGLEREAAVQSQANTRDAALAQYRQIGQVRGRQIAMAAANGVSIDFGTAGDAVADTNMLGREDVQRLYDRGGQELRGHDISASNYMGQASASRQAGTAALVGGAFSIGSTVLGSASQFKGIQAKMGSGGLTSSARSTIASNSAIF